MSDEHYECPHCRNMTSEPGHYNDVSDGALLCTLWNDYVPSAAEADEILRDAGADPDEVAERGRRLVSELSRRRRS